MKFEQVWQGRNCTEGGAPFAATVPGNIQYDYGVAHGFGDVQYADNYRQYLPLEDADWEYTAQLQYEVQEGERVFFVSDGIDYRCDISLNGKKILSHEGMFSRIEAELCDLLGGGRDTLTVHIYPHPKSRTGNPDTRDEADDSCKAPVCYGWDWNPRLLISGMWQEAYIETRGASYIGNAEALASLNEDMTEGKVRFSYTCAEPCTLELYDAEGTLNAKGEGPTVLSVEKPHLWWCNGQGEAYLYTWVIRNAHEERHGTLGFRRVRLVRNIGAGDPKVFPKTRYAPPTTVELNGRRILSKGSNWVNPELFWGRIDRARYDELLILTRDAGMNMLRVWGGSGICKQSFYDLCDRYGIMVWQEFMMACNNYPDTEKYLTVLESEARCIIRSLRSHPSLTLWCGGNELFNGWSGMTDQSLPLRLLNRLCYELDIERPFLPTSPLYGMGHGGYLFYSPEDGEVFRCIADSAFTAYTEFGVPSISSVENLKKAIPADELFPPRKTPSWVAHHGYGAWTPGSWLNVEIVDQYFGPSDGLEQLVARSSWLQSIGYQMAFEEMRRQWPYCGMMLNWCFDEPWITAGNNSLVEYPARPKPAYYAVQKALRPTLFSARVPKFLWTAGENFEADLYFLNDAPEAAAGKVHISLCIGDERIDLLDWEASAEANANRQGPTVRVKLPTVEQSDRMTLVLESENGYESSYLLRYNHKKRAHDPRAMNQ